ncbi:hypothetical protein NM208_g2251 [Fusarium decemcellulare]|uniref:Uncharacterized protein n=1 Tax=Fusarium decemcellulare TaxID=57161 RepID=A0ACC1ST55_9HYPO|nr:hypothetical protein NM208_g2251 [Fusarium decemcellulare]
MATRSKHYFLAPTGNPPEGPIRLGNIVSVPRLVDDPINEDYVPPSAVPMSIFEHNEPNYKVNISINKNSGIGIWASFLQVLGLGVDVIIEGSNEDSEQWACENLQTISFIPKLEYITKCLEDEGVQNYMRVNKPWLGSSKLYMVTGIKVAYGAASTVRYARGRGLNLHFGTDMSALGVPVSFGPQVGRSSTVSVEQSQDGAEPFVFAFRLRRIKISGKGDDIRHEKYDKGALLSIRKDESDQSESRVEVVVQGLEDDDAEGSEFRLDSKDAMDEVSTDAATCRVAASEEG